MLLAEIARTSEQVAATSARLTKIALLSACLAELEPAEVPIGVAYLSGEMLTTNVWRQGEAIDPNRPQPEAYNAVGVDFFQTLGIPIVAIVGGAAAV